MDIAAGEYGYDSGYFRRMLEAGAVDVLQADATRCAGITGFLQAAALCQACAIDLSAHCVQRYTPMLAAQFSGCVILNIFTITFASSKCFLTACWLRRKVFWFRTYRGPVSAWKSSARTPSSTGLPD